MITTSTWSIRDTFIGISVNDKVVKDVEIRDKTGEVLLFDEERQIIAWVKIPQGWHRHELEMILDPNGHLIRWCKQCGQTDRTWNNNQWCTVKEPREDKDAK